MQITDLLEALMILCFGISWPLSIYKSWKSRTSKGKSLTFELFVWIGYIFGITRKILQVCTATEPMGWLFYLAWAFYVMNLIEISIDIFLYFRNTKLDKLAEAAK